MPMNVSIRAAGPTVSVVSGGVDLATAGDSISLNFPVPGADSCAECARPLVRTLRIGESGVIDDLYAIDHPTTCTIAYCPHGILRVPGDCPICAGRGVVQ